MNLPPTPPNVQQHFLNHLVLILRFWDYRDVLLQEKVTVLPMMNGNIDLLRVLIGKQKNLSDEQVSTSQKFSKDSKYFNKMQLLAKYKDLP